MKDPAFRLFVRMMQSPDTLVNLSKHMAVFIAQKTYLEVNNPILFEKIAKYLTEVKQPKDQIKDDDDEGFTVN